MVKVYGIVPAVNVGVSLICWLELNRSYRRHSTDKASEFCAKTFARKREVYFSRFVAFLGEWRPARCWYTKQFAVQQVVGSRSETARANFGVGLMGWRPHEDSNHG